MTQRRQLGDDQCELLIRPNRSFRWSEARWFLVPTFVISLAIGIGFLLLGYWMILPFAGLELLALAAALVQVRLSGCRAERVTFTGDRVIVAKERAGQPEGPERVFQRAWARVVLARPLGGLQPSRLFIRSHGRRVELGDFLSDRERDDLARDLGGLLGPPP